MVQPEGEKALGDCINEYKNLMGGSKKMKPFRSGAQWQDKGQWAQIGIGEIPFKQYKNTFLTTKVDKHWNKLSKKVLQSPSMAIFKTVQSHEQKPAVVDNLLCINHSSYFCVIFHHAQSWSLDCGLSPEVHLIHSVILLQNSPLTLLAIHFKAVVRKYTLLSSSSNIQIYSVCFCMCSVWSMYTSCSWVLAFFIISKINQGGVVFSLSSPIQWHYALLAV